MQKLQNTNKQLEAKKKDLIAKARNQLKVAKRAKLKAEKMLSVQHQLYRDIKVLSNNLKQQEMNRKIDKNRHTALLDRVKKSRNNWKNRARAAEAAHRYNLGKTLQLKRPQTKVDGAYSRPVRSLCWRLAVSGIAASQVPKVIQMCTHAFGIEPGPIPGPRSVG